ncbi:peptidase S41-like protein [Blastococcus colisei]|uniref:Peptidase S41-like protein n=1 Tax=Blastococcus colisei TaxID=1564162 RepID=A0A543PF32_9ACTN|nr:S41 family peptidase [Blastococcus colisei]TQN42680.1 peptidase S41-like protein [Blastococcus colisei]
MTLATYVEMPTPRRAVDDRADDLLPADLTVAFGAEGAAVPGSVPLHDFMRTAGTLTHAERLLIVGQALLMLEGNYVHLPLKSAMHAVNPVQRLRLLRARLLRQTDATMDPERSFHQEMSSVFHSVRDLHTNYLLPQPFAGMIAYLPFQVERCVDGDRATYIVTRLAQGLSAPTFGVGVEITHWNGMPIERAVAVNADRFAGSNVAARLARGVDSLTVRALRLHLPPDEEWVTVSYTDADGVRRELREPWLVAPNAPAMADAEVLTTAAASQGLDLHADETSRARALLYAPRAVEQTLGNLAIELSTEPVAAGGDVASTMPLVFRARSVQTAAGTFGHLRVFTFNVPDPAAFVAEFVRLAELLPQEGLILDVRGNGGGHILASEFTLQTLTPRRITPEPVQFVCTPLNLEICRRHKDDPTGRIDLGAWYPSMDQSVETGSIYSSAFPISPEDGANSVGQRYFGPVVLITDARCYSATDIFAAGFQDHAIGPVLGVDDTTGAGGANVWTHGLLKALRDVPADPDSPYRPLPKQADMRVSIRRTLRVGALAGTPVEDLGVRADARHEMTRRDVLEGNVDLMEAAGALLAGRPRRRLDLTASVDAGGGLSLELRTTGLDRLDVYVDGRPRSSSDVADGTTTLPVPDAAGATVVQVQGFVAGDLVAARTEPL